MVVAAETLVGHDWRLVAPWWHWARKTDPGSAGRRGRDTGPVLQKYDTPDLVNTFLADPQRRLAFLESADEVVRVSGSLSALKAPTVEKTGIRKLYLASHHRHYLVVCSLHCDGPGFPHVLRDQACETGFVVRQRKVAVADKDRVAGADALRRVSLARRKRAEAEAQVAGVRRATSVQGLRLARLETRLAALAAVEAKAAGELKGWAEKAGVTRQLLGWVPRGSRDGSVVPMPACSGHVAHPAPATASAAGAAPESPPVPLAGVGAWQPVAEVPGEVEEAWFPLIPLVPDPGRPDHDGAGETVYFGVVPTGSSDVDPTGEARFDDEKTYEIRCFARRHRPQCPRTGPQCRCPAFWSEPTEPYRLASHFDLQGTGNKPVTVQMPDLAQLYADALRLGPGVGGVRFRTPPGSDLGFTLDTDKLKATDTGDRGDAFQICSFSIPLITIVATFVFKLFLPIVILVFQLWFLLLLKFCIPPELELGGGLDASLTALPPSLDMSASLAVDFEGKVPTVGNPTNKTNGQLLDAAFDGMGWKPPGLTLGQRLRQLANTPAGILGHLQLAKGALTPVAAPAGPPDRVFVPRVERHQVVAP